MSMSDLSTLSFDELDALSESPEAFAPIGQVVPVTVGKPATFTANIGGVHFPYTFTVKSALLTRLTQIVRTRAEGGLYNLLTGVMSHVDADLSVHVDGEQLNISEFFRKITNAEKTEDKQLSQEVWESTMAGAGFRWNTPDMVILFQHFGASEKLLNANFDAFIAAGAKDITANYPPNRLKEIRRIVFHETGLPISHFEIGSSDRTQSRTGQGFEDILQSQFDNWQRIIKGRVEVMKLRLELDEMRKDDKILPEDLRELEDQVALKRRQTTRWVNNWGGAQVGMTVENDGSITEGEEWFQQSVPCGRITVRIPVFEEMKDPATGEVVMSDGEPVMVRAKEPFLDAVTQEPILKDGAPIIVPAVKVAEWNFWKNQEDLGDNPVQVETEVDATAAGGPINEANDF